jgi:hypothetical protein
VGEEREDASYGGSPCLSPITISSVESDELMQDSRPDDRTIVQAPLPDPQAQASPSSPASVTHFSLLSSLTTASSGSNLPYGSDPECASLLGCRTDGHLVRYLETIQSQDPKGAGYLDAQVEVYDQVIRGCFDVECDSELIVLRGAYAN